MTGLACLLTGHLWCAHHDDRVGFYERCSRCTAVRWPGPQPAEERRVAA